MNGKTAFRILIAYEDRETGNSARNLVRRLAARLASCCRLESDPWKFELIGHPRLKRFVARAAGEADMIIIAAKGGEELPSSVRGWLECWASRHRCDPVALVALSPEQDEVRVPAPAWLAHLARTAAVAGADFFSPGRAPSEPLFARGELVASGASAC